MKFKMDPTKVLSVTATLLGVAGTLLSNKVDANNRKAMKEELKKELMRELTKNMKGSK